MGKIKIKTKKPWIAYPGSTIQQNYGEDLSHGYLVWDIHDRDNFGVKFYELINPTPYVTIDWTGDVESTIKFASSNFPQKSRFRIRSKSQLAQKDTTDLSSRLLSELLASDVTFKYDQKADRSIITTDISTILKEDLRNPDVIIKLFSKYHHDKNIPADEWQKVYDFVKQYVASVNAEEIVRNTKWSLRHLKFDNTFTYGTDNVINFDKLNGIIGIFGPNRSGKSSIVGTIMYALFNGTDRGSIKNIHVVNIRKPHCYSRAIISVSGVDYVIERQTTKSENKYGQINANTALNVFRIDNGEAIDLAGEQRTDTEKIIRNIIGEPEDFLLTSLSAQDEIKLFISYGSTKRRQILAKFLDLDIFDKMYDLARNDLNATKAIIKNYPDRDWGVLNSELVLKVKECDDGIQNRSTLLQEHQEKLDDLRIKLADNKEFIPVTKLQVDAQRLRVDQLNKQLNSQTTQLNEIKDQIEKLTTKIKKIDVVQKENNVLDLKIRLTAFRELETFVNHLRHVHEIETSTFNSHEKSLKILSDVPCGDQFPTCKFIKDAHVNKEKIDEQRIKTSTALESLKKADESLDILRQEGIAEQIEKIEQLNDLCNRFQLEISTKHIELVKIEISLNATKPNLDSAIIRLNELENALKNEQNAEVVSLRSEIDNLTLDIKKLDAEKLDFATERGKVRTTIDKYKEEKLQRDEKLQHMKTFELVVQAFSRKGIPSVITTSQLPIINAEIASILHGIVDFTIELEINDDNDATEIYINYGDSKRIIELCSGMEKMIASIAIRVALINISSLPKTDMFIIDEGFGALDDASVEACNRLLVSLKRYFRLILMISHVDAVKDIADNVIELTKFENDAKVLYA